MTEEVKLRLRKSLAELVLRDFEAWVKANVIFVGNPDIPQLIKRYLDETYVRDWE